MSQDCHIIIIRLAALFAIIMSTKPTYATLSAKHVYCMQHLFFHGAGLPVGLTTSNILAFQIWMALIVTEFLIAC